MVEGARQLSLAISHFSTVRTGDPACSNRLAELRSDLPSYATLSVIRADGKIICTTDSGASGSLTLGRLVGASVRLWWVWVRLVRRPLEAVVDRPDGRDEGMRRIDEQREAQQNAAVSLGLACTLHQGVRDVRSRRHASLISRGMSIRGGWAITCRCRTASSAPLGAWWIQRLLTQLGRHLNTALDFVNGMIAEHTNPKEEPIADEVGRAEA